MKSYCLISFLETSGTEVIFLFLALLGATFGKIYPSFFQCKAISLLLPVFCIFLVLTLELHISPVAFFSARFPLFLANLWRHVASMDLIQVLSLTVSLQRKHGSKIVFVVVVVFFVSLLSSSAGSLHVPSNERY